MGGRFIGGRRSALALRGLALRGGNWRGGSEGTIFADAGRRTDGNAEVEVVKA